MSYQFVVGTLTKLNVLSSRVDAVLGYPKAGVDVGGGNHAPGPFVTQRHANIITRRLDGATLGYPLKLAAHVTAYLTIRQNAIDAVNGGTATPAQSLIATLPDPTPDDGTWL